MSSRRPASGDRPGKRAEFLAAGLLLAGLCLGVVRSEAATSLASRHKKWLEEEVVYIISDDEKKAFRNLTSDEDRDKFISRFWEMRDPTPGTPQNEYKDEHYRRLEYAKAYFGSEWNRDGWRSDRGKIYIILGPPGSRQHHVSGGELYPIELWFYTTSEPALPSFFYVMFYQREGMSDFRLYSPYMDGPTRLVRTSGTENNPRGAFRRLAEYNVEVARASLTLIPSEPADINTPISLTSDGMLMKIINLANDRFHKERVERQGQLREEVKVRITFDVPALAVAVLPLWNPAGEAFIDYTLQIPEPQNYTLGRYQDKYYLGVEAQVRVLDAQSKLIYEKTREGVAYYTEKEAADARTRPLNFDDRIAVTPGDYELEFMLLNRVDQVYYRGTAKVHVEPQPVPGLRVGDPVLVERCEPAQGTEDPFIVGNSRCHLQARLELPPGPNTSLNVLYPVYLDSGAKTAGDQPLKVEYTLGRLDHALPNRTTEDTLRRERFDRFGTLLVGKSLPLTELPPGAYRLAVRVTDPVTARSSATALAFRLGANPLPSPNVVSPEEALRDETTGENDYWRGLCALAHKAPQEAATYFSRAVQHNDQHQRARARLVELYFAQGEYEKVAALLEAGGLSRSTDLATVRKLLASLEKTGQLQRAIQTAEQAVALLEPSPELYEDLADLYGKAGDNGRAQQAREEARRLSGLRKQTKSENR